MEPGFTWRWSVEAQPDTSDNYQTRQAALRAAWDHQVVTVIHHSYDPNAESELRSQILSEETVVNPYYLPTIEVDLVVEKFPRDIELIDDGGNEFDTLTYERMVAAAETSGYTGVKVVTASGGHVMAIVAVCYDDGTCGLNDLGAATWPPEGSDWRCLAKVHECWYDPSQERNTHACASCQSKRYEIFDTGVRIPELNYNTSWM